MSGSINKARRGMRPKPGNPKKGTGGGNQAMSKCVTNDMNKAVKKAGIDRELK